MKIWKRASGSHLPAASSIRLIFLYMICPWIQRCRTHDINELIPRISITHFVSWAHISGRGSHVLNFGIHNYSISFPLSISRHVFNIDATVSNDEDKVTSSIQLWISHTTFESCFANMRSRFSLRSLHSVSRKHVVIHSGLLNIESR